ncbi:hypothetical protein DSECCO2_85120 [anaerobic digester metagenome]
MNLLRSIKQILIERKVIFAYFISSLLSLIAVILVLQLWNADFCIPFSYNGDTLSMSLWIKGLIENSWWYTNNNLGMPFGQENYDFPLTNSLDLTIIKVLGIFFQNYALTYNIFFILTFPLTTIVSFYVFQKLGISIVPGIFGSLLFTFIPYHFLRGLPHIFLTSYYIIPLITLVLIWIYEEKPIFFNFNARAPFFINYYTIFSIISCGLCAIHNIYYCFFACFLFIVVGFVLFVKRNEKKYFITSIILIGLMVSILLLNSIPVFHYQYENGSNRDATLRSPVDTEMYGLKIAQLLLPIPGHRIPIFAQINSRYSSTAPLVNENGTSGLGMIGAMGFLFLIIWFFIRIGNNPYSYLPNIQAKLDCLATLTLSSVLLATIGGFSSIIAYLGFYEIRGYNRISIFLAFFAITTIILLIDTLYKRKFLKKGIFVVLLCCILFVGLLDQTTQNYVPNYNLTKQDFFNHQQYIDSIEKIMPKNAMIYQLPYVPYMGWGKGSERLPLYEKAIPYLHSTNLRWSYGAMINRKGDLWQRAISELPIEEQVREISYMGFNGILIDSKGYFESEKPTINNLSIILGSEPIISSDQRFLFYNMSNYNSNLKNKLGIEQFEKIQNQKLNPPMIRLKWEGKFSIPELSDNREWRWCGNNGVLLITNPMNESVNASLETNFFTGHKELSQVIINYIFSDSNDNDIVDLNSSGSYYKRNIQIPPEGLMIEFKCDAEKIIVPGDNRELVFFLENFRLTSNDEEVLLYK